MALLRRYVKGSVGTRISSVKATDTVRQLVLDYFQTIRATFARAHGALPKLPELDAQMQDLLRCSQKRSTVSKYRAIGDAIHDTLDELEIQALVPSGASVALDPLHVRDRRIVQTLANISHSAAYSYEQACLDLLGPDRVSLRGTAVEMREALREIVHELASDDEVTKTPGFRLEKGLERPTTKQRVRFILKSRKLRDAQIRTTEDAIDVVDSNVSDYVRTLQEAAQGGTHGLPTKASVLRMKSYLVPALEELLEIPPS